jgi:putative phosphoribosyl transferase
MYLAFIPDEHEMSEATMSKILKESMEKNAFDFPIGVPENISFFDSRKEAGRRLALSLEEYRWQNPLILAIPPGGAEVGLEVARYLGADLSLIISRKLPSPDNPEACFGAIAEDESTYLHVNLAKQLSAENLDAIKNEQLRAIQRDIAAFRKGKQLPEISGRVVILIDAGLALGSTMKAAFLLCRKRRAAKIIVAVPLTWRKALTEIQWVADKVIALQISDSYETVALIYDRWSDIPDEEVLRILANWRNVGH